MKLYLGSDFAILGRAAVEAATPDAGVLLGREVCMHRTACSLVACRCEPIALHGEELRERHRRTVRGT